MLRGQGTLGAWKHGKAWSLWKCIDLKGRRLKRPPPMAAWRWEEPPIGPGNASAKKVKPALVFYRPLEG